MHSSRAATSSCTASRRQETRMFHEMVSFRENKVLNETICTSTGPTAGETRPRDSLEPKTRVNSLSQDEREYTGEETRSSRDSLAGWRSSSCYACLRGRSWIDPSNFLAGHNGVNSNTSAAECSHQMTRWAREHAKSEGRRVESAGWVAAAETRLAATSPSSSTSTSTSTSTSRRARENASGRSRSVFWTSADIDHLTSQQQGNKQRVRVRYDSALCTMRRVVRLSRTHYAQVHASLTQTQRYSPLLRGKSISH